MWDAMDPDSKGAYKRRTEQAKKEYLRQLASYRATLVSKGNTLESPYNGKGLADVTKVGEPDSRSPYLMNPRYAWTNFQFDSIFCLTSNNVVVESTGFLSLLFKKKSWKVQFKDTDFFLEMLYPSKYGPEKYDLYFRWKKNQELIDW